MTEPSMLERCTRAAFDAIRHAPTGIGVEMWSDNQVDDACASTAKLAVRAVLDELSSPDEAMIAEGAEAWIRISPETHLEDDVDSVWQAMISQAKKGAE